MKQPMPLILEGLSLTCQGETGVAAGFSLRKTDDRLKPVPLQRESYSARALIFPALNP